MLGNYLRLQEDKSNFCWPPIFFFSKKDLCKAKWHHLWLNLKIWLSLIKLYATSCALLLADMSLSIDMLQSQPATMPQRSGLFSKAFHRNISVNRYFGIHIDAMLKIACRKLHRPHTTHIVNRPVSGLPTTISNIE